MRDRRRFPFQTIFLLGLTTYLLVLVLNLWWTAKVQGEWSFTWQTWTPWEPWFDAVLLHAGAVFVAYRLWGLIQALWRRWGP